MPKGPRRCSPSTRDASSRSELHRPEDLWYPTILGVLVVVAAVGLFCGSIYLLLGTNLGARLGVPRAVHRAHGFMVVLTSLWITTASPLNTLKGRVPKWEIKEVVTDARRVEDRRGAQTSSRTARKVDAIEAANVKAAVDEGLVTQGRQRGRDVHARGQRVRASSPTSPTTSSSSTYEIGGSEPELARLRVHAHAAVRGRASSVAPTRTPTVVRHGPADARVCDRRHRSAENNGFVVLEFNLGDVRLPPIVAFFSSIILFVLGLLMLALVREGPQGRRRGERGRRRHHATTPDRVREPANA